MNYLISDIDGGFICVRSQLDNKVAFSNSSPSKGTFKRIYAYILNVIHYTLAYKVYVIELSKKIFTADWRFRSANPQYNGVLECLYVGMTSKTPAERLEQLL